MPKQNLDEFSKKMAESKAKFQSQKAKFMKDPLVRDSVIDLLNAQSTYFESLVQLALETASVDLK